MDVTVHGLRQIHVIELLEHMFELVSEMLDGGAIHDSERDADAQATLSPFALWALMIQPR